MLTVDSHANTEISGTQVGDMEKFCVGKTERPSEMCGVYGTEKGSSPEPELPIENNRGST